jgi:hypothetical protein
VSVMWLVARWPWLGFLSDGALAYEERIIDSAAWNCARYYYGPEHRVTRYYEELRDAIHTVQKHRESYAR